MSVLDLDTADLTWIELTIAGADTPTRMSPLWSDTERELRSVIVEFPAGWRRDAVGNQPAQEEMVVLQGATHVSGLQPRVGQLLVGAPRCTRSATFSEEDCRVLVWFTGETGGWQDGPANPPVEMRLVDLELGIVRPEQEGLRGSIDVREGVAGATFDHDVDLVSVDQRKWAHLAAGAPAPDLSGQVVIKHWT